MDGQEGVPQAVAKSDKDEHVDNAIFSIPWRHHVLILNKIKDVKETE